MGDIFKYKQLMSFRKYHHLVLNTMFVKCYHLLNIKPILTHSSLSSLVFVHGSLTVKQFASTMMCEFGYIFISNNLLLNRRIKIILTLKQKEIQFKGKVIPSSEYYIRKLLVSSTKLRLTIQNPSYIKEFVY